MKNKRKESSVHNKLPPNDQTEEWVSGHTLLFVTPSFETPTRRITNRYSSKNKESPDFSPIMTRSRRSSMFVQSVQHAKSRKSQIPMAMNPINGKKSSNNTEIGRPLNLKSKKVSSIQILKDTSEMETRHSNKKLTKKTEVIAPNCSTRSSQFNNKSTNSHVKSEKVKSIKSKQNTRNQNKANNSSASQNNLTAGVNHLHLHKRRKKPSLEYIIETDSRTPSKESLGNSSKKIKRKSINKPITSKPNNHTPSNNRLTTQVGKIIECSPSLSLTNGRSCKNNISVIATPPNILMKKSLKRNRSVLLVDSTPTNIYHSPSKWPRKGTPGLLQFDHLSYSKPEVFSTPTGRLKEDSYRTPLVKTAKKPLKKKTPKSKKLSHSDISETKTIDVVNNITKLEEDDAQNSLASNNPSSWYWCTIL